MAVIGGGEENRAGVLPLCRVAFAKGSLVSRSACSADARACAQVDPKVRTRQRMSVLAVCLGGEGHIFGVADNGKVVRIPADMDAT
jgi:hypothetical protein